MPARLLPRCGLLPGEAPTLRAVLHAPLPGHSLRGALTRARRAASRQGLP